MIDLKERFNNHNKQVDPHNNSLIAGLWAFTFTDENHEAYLTKDVMSVLIGDNYEHFIEFINK
jgi:hypothetical protein